ncbi:MAG: asparagine synthase (glutamine-hydrolyzing) [Desulfovibrio sp.]
MCGIVGIFDLQAQTQSENLERSVQKMADAIRHRGPDDHGYFHDPRSGIALGHRRLSILDLSPSGHQPMADHSGRYTIVYNGELYNFPEVKRALEYMGVTNWRGSSDTEILLAAIKAFGVEGALQKFRGMFAFALWDKKEQTLTLGRDRLGEKPLYYTLIGNTLIFGSELKGLIAHPEFSPEIDRNALGAYLRYHYVPTPFSIYKNTFKLPQGTTLQINAEDHSLPEPKPYWTLEATISEAREDTFHGTEKEALDCLNTILLETVRNQMVSDVPLGSLLSGGVDSSLVTSLMTRSGSGKVKTFTIGYDDPAYNEAQHAAQVANHLGTDHTEMTATPDDILQIIPKVPTIYDEPFSDASQLPSCLVSALTRQHVTVCLSGDGGDETFGGYNRHFWAPSIWNKISSLHPQLRKFAALGMTSLSPKTWDTLFQKTSPVLPASMKQRLPGHKLHKLASVLPAKTPQELYKGLVSNWHNPDALLKNGQEYSGLLENKQKWPIAPGSSAEFTQWMQYMDTSTYLADDIMVKMDRAAMAVSLESRAPFLDHEVLAFAWRLPLHMKIRNGEGKYCLKQLLYRYVPQEIVDRPKMGFGVPLDQWLRGPLKEWAQDMLQADKLEKQGYFSGEAVAKTLKTHLSGKADMQYKLWNILVFQSWLDKQQGEIS